MARPVHRRMLLAVALVLGLLLTALPRVSAQDNVADARAAAAAWLAAAHDDGEVQGVGSLADVIFALVAAEADPVRVDAVRADLEQLVLDGQGDATQPSVGELAKSALAIAAAGGDPEDVDGTSLIIPLRNRIVDGNADDGRIGDAGPFIQALGVLALAATPDGVPAETVGWLADQACDDDGFNFLVTEDDEGVSQGCPAGETGEADTTALVIQALLGVDAVTDQRDAAVQWLLGQQSTDGAIDGNANSTGLAGQTFRAVGEAAAAGAAADFIVTLQYSAGQPDAGAIRFTAEADGSLLLATTQGVLGLDVVSFPELVGVKLAPTPPPAPTPTPTPTMPPTPGPDDPIERIAGDTRMATAIAASQAGFADEAAAGVVLARADAFADALSGTPLAAQIGGPLLITASDALAADVAAELQRVLAVGETVTLLGGTAALSEQVVTDVEALGLTPRRLAGDTRITTAIAVAESMPDPTTVLLTTGSDFPDALTAGTAAAANGRSVVLLTPGDQPSSDVDAYLQRVLPAEVFAIGGPAVAAYPTASPLAGPSRESTAVAVAEEFFADPSAVALARRDGFADALAGGVLAADRGAPLLLTDTTTLSSDTAAYVCNTNSVDGAVLLGGTGAVSDAVAETVTDLLVGDGCA